MIKSNEKNEIEQTITVLVLSAGGNFTLHPKLDSTLKDFLIEAKKSFTCDYKFATVGFLNTKKTFTKSDLNLKLAEIGVVDNCAIQINVYDEKTENAINLEDLESKKVEEKKVIVMGKSSWSLFKTIVGVIDLLLLGATVTTFLLFFFSSLSFSIVWPIVFTFLFVIDTILFLGFNKILPKGWIGSIDLGTGFYEKDQNETKTKNKYEQEQNNPEKNENQEEEKGE